MSESNRVETIFFKAALAEYTLYIHLFSMLTFWAVA